MVVKDLRSLKYHELQKLAKSAGIKANQKIEKLIKALEEYYIESESDCETEKDVISDKDGGTQYSHANTETSISTGDEYNQQATTRTNTSKSSPTNKTAEISSIPSQVSDSKQTKKRRRTFELEEPTLSAANTPTAEDKTTLLTRSSSSRTKTPVQDAPAGKRQRKNTYNKTESPPKEVPGSPGTTEMIASIDATQSSAERRAKLLSVLDKKVQNRVAASPSAKQTSQTSQIPRFMAYYYAIKKEKELESKSATQSKPSTPEKKQQRKDLLTGSGKKPTPKLDSRRNNQPAGQQRIAKPVARPTKTTATKPFVPTVTSTKGLTFNFGAAKTPSKLSAKVTQNGTEMETKSILPQSASKTSKSLVQPINSARKSEGSVKKKPASQSRIAKPVMRSANTTTKPFVPSVTSTKGLTFNFGASKTPLKPSVTKSVVPPSASKTPKAAVQSTSSARKSIGSVKRASPYRFIGANMSTTAVNSASKKSVFDLKASLARPLTWRPHTGKLQPVDINVSSLGPGRPEAPVLKPKPVMQKSRQAMASKMRSTNPKAIRRVEQLDRRNNQKYIDMMKRRGLMA